LKRKGDKEGFIKGNYVLIVLKLQNKVEGGGEGGCSW
jgi:hypothetical protein